MGHSPTKRMRMDIDAEEEHTSTPATGTGLSVLPCRRHLQTNPKINSPTPCPAPPGGGPWQEAEELILGQEAKTKA